MEKFNSFAIDAENVIGGLSLSVVGGVSLNTNTLVCPTPTPVVYCPQPVVHPCPPVSNYIRPKLHANLLVGSGLNL